MNNRLAFSVTALVIAVPAVTRAQAATATVDKAVAAWSMVKSLSGTFEQTLTNSLMHTTSVAHGNFSQERPSKLAIRFTDPAGDAIVSDGKFLWVYLKQASPGQVIKRPATDALDVPIDVSVFLDSPATKYDIVAKGAEAVAGRPTHVLVLTPKKGARAPFSRGTVWVDDADGMIRQFEVVEGSGNTRRIRLVTVNVNPTLAASDFVFTIPKGVKIITP